MTKHYQCPVCGYSLLVRPPENHEICPSCGTEFDYHDFGTSHNDLRQLWLQEGAHWFSSNINPPAGWDAHAQLRNAGLAEDYPATFVGLPAVPMNVYVVSAFKTEASTTAKHVVQPFKGQPRNVLVVEADLLIA